MITVGHNHRSPLLACEHIALRQFATKPSAHIVLAPTITESPVATQSSLSSTAKCYDGNVAANQYAC